MIPSSARWLARLSGAVLLLCFAGQAQSDPIQGAGSTFAAPIIQKWSRDYEAARTDGGDFTSPDWKVDYELVGSLAGIMRLDQPELDFAATDVPLAPAELAKHGRQQFPIVMGGIAVVAHLDGVDPGSLRLSGPVLAGIYLGKIARWSDPAIRALNPQLQLPDSDITVLHRQDGSGSTFAFTQFLAAASPEWKEKVGADTLVTWPIGTGAEGTAALLSALGTTKGAIGYADFGQAQRAKLAFAAIANKAGQFVTPEPAGVAAAASSADWSGTNGFAASLGDGGADGAYPLSVATFAVLPVAGRPAQRYRRVHDLFRVAFSDGAEQARALGYVPLPPELVSKIESYWATVPVATR
jgi:phosphate transport system substrate-binding protein